MDWRQMDNYCERGGDPGLWAEPLNAISNGAFIIAGLIAAWQLARSPRRRDLCALRVAHGSAHSRHRPVGSFMFHTYATVWAIPFDTIPISSGPLAYLAYALRCFAGLPWILVIGSLIASMRPSATCRASSAQTSSCR